MNILDLYSQDVTERPFSVSGGREYRGPCPICGGNDRFGIFPQQNNGNGSFFCGRARGGGKGCGIGGDAIQYLIDVRKLSYRQACDYLGIEAKRGKQATRYRYHLPEISRPRQDVFTPEDKQFPADVVDSGLWMTKGMEFVEKCHEALLNRSASIAYLLARGISREGIAKYKLGFHVGEERNGQKYEPSFRSRAAWGLSPQTNDKGKQVKMMLPAGLVIPYIVDGRLHRITIRLIKKDPRNPRKKYHYLRGSIRDLFVTNPAARIFATIEAELDCIAVDCAAGDIVSGVGIGSSGVRPDARAAALLAASSCILGAHDYDEAGAKGGDFWEETYAQYIRWPVPVGKDPGELFQAGVDLRQWLLAGIPEFLLPATGDVEKHEIVSEKQEEVLEKQETSPTDEDQHPKTEKEDANQRKNNDLYELKMLLHDAKGLIRVYDGGVNVCKEVPKQWMYANPEKSGRISELLNTSPMVGEYLGMVGDGLYPADRIPVGC
jgi:DNA primase